MSERGVGKPWTTYEDNLLKQAVAIHGENDNWKAVAASVPGRTNKACRKRWLHSLSPNVKKSAWTPEEDQLLLSLYATHNTKWSVIARHIPGRTDDACSKRYREALDPFLKRDDWTADEDSKLVDAYARLGGKWGHIGQELNRSGLGCRNRWRMLERKRAALTRDVTARGEILPSAAAPTGTPSQWQSTQVQEPQFWDGRSPQYVAPSVLYQASPLHSQESHSPAYSPEQILSGAHLGRPSSRSQERSEYQFPSSSFGTTLPITQSSGPPSYYDPTAFSQRDGASAIPGIHDSTTEEEHVRFESYEFIPIEVEHRDSPSPGHYQDSRTPVVRDSSASAVGGPSNSIAGNNTAVPVDSPASPSQCTSPSPPTTPARVQHSESIVGHPVADAPQTHAYVPKPYYLSDAEKARRIAATRKPSQQRPVRLSSVLPATTNTDVLAYACGHSNCWPTDAASSKSAFATSKELSDHSKFYHNGDLGGSRPFRCGLTGCEKSWKSINGLQYHLQISRYHFQQALATRIDSADTGGMPAMLPDMPTDNTLPRGQLGTSNSDSGNPPLVVEAEAEARSGTAPIREVSPQKVASGKPQRKLHPCTHPGCGKQYKQLSGLRYHLAHGHVDALPLQLDVVPPTLARIVSGKGATQ